MISNYYLLPEFTPARLQDLVLWFEPASLRGNTWCNLAPCYSGCNDGTAYGAVGLSSWHPQFAPALEFYAEDDYIDLPLDIVFDDEMSIEILFELYDYTDNGRVLGSQHSNGNYYEIRAGAISTKTFFLYVSNGNNTIGTSFYLDDWHTKTHGVWTWKYNNDTNWTTFKSYKDGEYEETKTFSGKVQLPDVNLRLGHWKTYGMKGKIYLVRFYHKVLSNDEIRHNYTHHPLYYIGRGIDPHEFIRRRKFYFL